MRVSVGMDLNLHSSSGRHNHLLFHHGKGSLKSSAKGNHRKDYTMTRYCAIGGLQLIIVIVFTWLSAGAISNEAKKEATIAIISGMNLSALTEYKVE